MTLLGRQGIRLRLGLLYLSIFAVGLSVFCAVLFQYFVSTQMHSFDSELYNRAVVISNSLELDFMGRMFHNDTKSDAGMLSPFSGMIIEVRDIRGKVLLQSRLLGDHHLPLDVETLREALLGRVDFHTFSPRAIGFEGGSSDLRLVTYSVRHEGWAEPVIMQIAVAMDFPLQERRDLQLFFLLGIPTFLLISLVVGIWMSRAALRPVHDMTLKARDITGVEKLKERIPVPVANDEIRELAETFNGLLDRLDKAFASQDRFIANASHQLRTPLTILKGELELMRKSPSTDMQSGLESVSVEINRLIQLVQDLLLLARLEAGQDTIAFKSVRVDEVLMKVVARLQKLARNKQVQITTHFSSETPGSELEAEVAGDEELLDSMFENFVENAVKYAPASSVVELTMKVFPQRIEVAVRDSGPGIPVELRQKIFERFTRVQPSHIVPGSGLGLSIAAEIARLHKVKIDLVAQSVGTAVTLTLARN